MKEINPAKIAVICFLFLAVLYLTSALDWAVTAAFISLVVLFGFEAAWLFIAAFVAFLLYLIFIFLNLKIDYILDLSVASYAFFVTGLILYFRQGQKQKWQVALPFAQRINITGIDLAKLGGILVFVFLIYPLTNAYLAAILGYIAFSVVFKKQDGRYAFGIALFFLTLCPFLLIAKKDKVAETSAIFTYYFLVVGVVQEIISLIREPKTEEGVEELQVKKVQMEAKHERKYIFAFWEGKNLAPVFFAGLLSFLVSISLFYLIFTFMPKLPKISFVKKQVPPTPTVFLAPSPTVTIAPTPVTKVTTESAKLKILIQNGTEITGLAASTAAKLKKVGFLDVDIGNASHQDYTSWELATKEKREDLSQLLKNVLELKDLKSSEATIPAGFEALIIAGQNK